MTKTTLRGINDQLRAALEDLVRQALAARIAAGLAAGNENTDGTWVAGKLNPALERARCALRADTLFHSQNKSKL